MICSSVNLDRFIVRPLSGGGLYSNLEEVQGLRSIAFGGIEHFPHLQTSGVTNFISKSCVALFVEHVAICNFPPKIETNEAILNRVTFTCVKRVIEMHPRVYARPERNFWSTSQLGRFFKTSIFCWPNTEDCPTLEKIGGCLTAVSYSKANTNEVCRTNFWLSFNHYENIRAQLPLGRIRCNPNSPNSGNKGASEGHNLSDGREEQPFRPFDRFFCSLSHAPLGFQIAYVASLSALAISSLFGGLFLLTFSGGGRRLWFGRGLFVASLLTYVFIFWQIGTGRLDMNCASAEERTD